MKKEEINFDLLGKEIDFLIASVPDVIYEYDTQNPYEKIAFTIISFEYRRFRTPTRKK